MATVIGPRPPSDEDDAAGSAAESPLPELADGHWMHRATEFAHTSFGAVARRLPALIREAVALAWATSRRDTIASIGLNVAAGVLTTLGLLATTGVLRQLFAAGPTPDRIRAALPALIIAALAVTVRGALTVAAGWAQTRLIPITHRLANVRHADRIFVLDHGRLVRQGDHDELMAQDGPYRELFELQAAGYLAGTGERPG